MGKRRHARAVACAAFLSRTGWQHGRHRAAQVVRRAVKASAPTAPPPKVTPKQVAKILGVPVSSPLVQDVIEALYGTTEYLDISEEFEPSKRKVTPAATQKQRQQTKMAQGGYLDAALAEEMSVDELLKLLR